MRYKLKSVEDCKELMQRVLPDYITPTDSDDDRMIAIKTAIKRLPADEQALFVLHTEIGSYRTIAKIFGVSRTTVLNKVKAIRQKIKTKL